MAMSGQWARTVALVVLCVVVACHWKTEIDDRNRNNREFARLHETNPSCTTYLRRVARTPSWRVHLAISIACALLASSMIPNVDWTKTALVVLLVVFIGLQTSIHYHRWHIMCHAMCTM